VDLAPCTPRIRGRRTKCTPAPVNCAGTVALIFVKSSLRRHAGVQRIRLLGAVRFRSSVTCNLLYSRTLTPEVAHSHFSHSLGHRSGNGEMDVIFFRHLRVCPPPPPLFCLVSAVYLPFSALLLAFLSVPRFVFVSASWFLAPFFHSAIKHAADSRRFPHCTYPVREERTTLKISLRHILFRPAVVVSLPFSSPPLQSPFGRRHGHFAFATPLSVHSPRSVNPATYTASRLRAASLTMSRLVHPRGEPSESNDPLILCPVVRHQRH
jgi:hypothetical protein